MSTITELFDKVEGVVRGHDANSIMAVMTAITAAVLFETIRDDKTIDDAMALFKKQVQDHVDRLERGLAH